jgi:hypothetical protein
MSNAAQSFENVIVVSFEDDGGAASVAIPSLTVCARHRVRRTGDAAAPE